jgi:hypothetical protein
MPEEIITRVSSSSGQASAAAPAALYKDLMEWAGDSKEDLQQQIVNRSQEVSMDLINSGVSDDARAKAMATVHAELTQFVSTWHTLPRHLLQYIYFQWRQASFYLATHGIMLSGIVLGASPVFSKSTSRYHVFGSVPQAANLVYELLFKPLQVQNYLRAQT